MPSSKQTKHPDEFEKYDIFSYNFVGEFIIARVISSSSYSFDYIDIWSERLFHSARKSYIRGEEAYYRGKLMKNIQYICTVYNDDRESIIFEVKKQFPELFI